jgi:hypothetical protein
MSPGQGAFESVITSTQQQQQQQQQQPPFAW